MCMWKLLFCLVTYYNSSNPFENYRALGSLDFLDLDLSKSLSSRLHDSPRFCQLSQNSCQTEMDGDFGW